MLDIIKAYAVKNLCYITAQKMFPKGIVVHSTGANNPYLKRYVDAPNEVGINQYGNHWNVPKPGMRKVCVHSFIGYDINQQVRVAQILPYNYCCWGVGQGTKGSYNYAPAYIQFEICEDSLNDREYYTKVFETAAEYCAELCTKYNISVSNIVGHCEAYAQGYGSNHSDPEHWMQKFGENMNDFRNSVSEFLKDKKMLSENKEDAYSKSTSFRKGDLVSILENATYYGGKLIPKWVRSQKWYIKDVTPDGLIIIDKNESETNSIFSIVDKLFLKLEKAANPSTTNAAHTETQSKKCQYLVKVTADCLNIRNGPGTNASITGSIKNKGIYTIIEEKEGLGASKWGKLKSGAGWISLDYVKKL